VTRRPPYNVSDETDYGYKIFAGRELSDHVSVEGFWADLGKAGIGPKNAGSVDYNVYGASLQVSIPENNPGFSTFIKGGVVGLHATSNLPHHTDEDFQVYGGAGAEYQLENGFTVRGEYEYYTKDAQLLSFSLIKRFGGDYEELVEEGAPVVRESLHPASPVADKDQDGVSDIKDRCPATPDGAPVNDKGCPSFVGVMEGIRFDTNSDRLRPETRRILDKVARGIKAYPGQHFVIIGHTDNVGNPAANKKLSLKRARAVAKYLVLRGVPARQLRYGGYGSAKPRATNSTPEGRAKNRRVEIFMSKK
jgi:outer membrane protein OmpA-like peptidoglycan-associated protein